MSVNPDLDWDTDPGRPKLCPNKLKNEEISF
jgi:hypothetical protein